MAPTPIAGVLLAFVAIAPPVLALAAAAPPTDGAPMVVITAPWRTATDVVDRAGGVVLADGRLTNIASTYAPADGYADALRGAGAWAVLSGDFSGFLCAGDDR